MGWTVYIDTYTEPEAQQWGLIIRYLHSSFRDKTSSSVQLQYMCENKCFDQGIVLLHGDKDEAGGKIPFCAPVGSTEATEPTSWLPG